MTYLLLIPAIWSAVFAGACVAFRKGKWDAVGVESEGRRMA